MASASVLPPRISNAVPNSSTSSERKPSNRNIKEVVLGDILLDTWYPSTGYPFELLGGTDTVNRLYVCHHCFRYTTSATAHVAHTTRYCKLRVSAPPGEKVYDYDGFMIWEVDGEEEPLFAQNLSLFAKLFLETKSIYFDVDSFYYYVLTYSESGREDDATILGFFSKEKQSWDANNLACILIFPPYQHRQLGKLLMGISYKFSAWEWEDGVIGGPEKPISEMGMRSYTRFWQERVSRFLLKGPEAESQMRSNPELRVRSKKQKRGGAKRKAPEEEMTVREIGEKTGMLPDDVTLALKELDVLEPVKKTGTKRKQDDAEDDDGGIVEVAVRKKAVLRWVRDKRVDLKDPVREEGFTGEWGPEETSDEDQKGSDEDTGDSDE